MGMVSHQTYESSGQDEYGNDYDYMDIMSRSMMNHGMVTTTGLALHEESGHAV